MPTAALVVQIFLAAVISAIAATFSRSALVWAACVCIVVIVLLHGGWEWLRARDVRVSALIVALLSAGIGAGAWLVFVAARPVQEAEFAERLLLPFEDRVIRDAVFNLVHELKQVSGKQFRDECILRAGDKLGPEKQPMSLFALTPAGKFSVVQSLRPVVNAFATVETGFLFQQNPIGGRTARPGYERFVFDEYSSLVSQPWVLAADRYVDGAALTGNETYNICLYGLRPIDELPLARMLSAIDQAEAAILATPLRLPQVDAFKLAVLDKSLRDAGLPFDGLSSPQANPTPENDTNPAEYFKLRDGRYLRATLPAQVQITPEQREAARKIIARHEAQLGPFGWLRRFW